MNIPTSEAVKGICRRNIEKVKIVTEHMSDFSNLCSTPVGTLCLTTYC